MTKTTSAGGDARIILVSNRLPVSVTAHEGRAEVKRSSGGLATGLSGLHARGDSLWLGWPGELEALSPPARAEVSERLAALRVVPVELSKTLVERFYGGFANGVLWPTFHYLIDRIPLFSTDWEAYVEANEKFADVVAAHATEDDVIWIHDYQLMLLPALLRRRLPSARIGFFLHIPFPSSEVFRILPWSDPILRGLLGADLIGFHTFDYARHFTTSLLRLLGLEPGVDHLNYEGRKIQISAFPMSIDGPSFVALAESDAVAQEVETIRAEAGDRKLLFGVDRLDYTKGILRRMLAVERLLEREPSFAGRLRLIQLVVPSRETVGEYSEHRRELELIVSRINGKHGTLQDAPIHYLYRSVSQEQLVAMFRAADVMVVTPLRDGMNLVAKEFVASRVDGDGVLLLSQLAGAAAELGEALQVNPYDVEGVARGLAEALAMPETERRRRMKLLRTRVLGRTVFDWALEFIATLEAIAPRTPTMDLRNLDVEEGTLLERVAEAPQLAVLLDYDGTLVEIEARPELAAPDAALLPLLDALAATPGVGVHVVSGRDRATLERWVGRARVALHAEHGVWSRTLGTDDWTLNVHVPLDWKPKVRGILEQYSKNTPGSFIEEKSAGIAWHYRTADRQLGALRARDLRLHLVESLAQQPVTVLAGDKVIEIRPIHVTKAHAVRVANEQVGPEGMIVAIGDDRTDEDMFVALPHERGISIAVGSVPSRAGYRFSGPKQVRAFLRALIQRRGGTLPQVT